MGEDMGDNMGNDMEGRGRASVFVPAGLAGVMRWSRRDLRVLHNCHAVICGCYTIVAARGCRSAPGAASRRRGAWRRRREGMLHEGVLAREGPGVTQLVRREERRAATTRGPTLSELERRAD
eukprot:635786-Pyramimonas_sp.AAC.1